jgi:thiol:disulfide interchange protein DsbD
MSLQRNHFQSARTSGMNQPVRRARGRLAVILFSLAMGVFPARGATTKVDLVLSADAVRPGDTIMAGIHLVMQPNWHTYWRNPGDAGIATTVKWTLPVGITAGEIQWPVPEKLVADDLTGYVYDQDVVLLVPITLASNLPSGPLPLKAEVNWLECSLEGSCVQGKAAVESTLNVGAETTTGAGAGLIDTWRNKLPLSGSDLAAKAWWEKPAVGDLRPVIFEWPAPAASAKADFFPYGSEKFDVQSKTEELSAPAGKVRLRVQIKKEEEGDWPGMIAGLLVETTGTGVMAHEINLPIENPVVAAAPAPSAGNASGLPYMLLLAFLGGLILNVMPCVLPVIALKILGFVNQSRQTPAQVRKLGLVYAAGILVSFLLLAAFVIGVKSLGHAASWGMQFEDPRIVLAMTVLVTLVALNLFGVFEVNLSGGAMQAAGNLAAKEGGAGAFFNGVLAVALATPCTAPVLASALGFAFTQPPAIIVLFFLTVGAGLAAPYVVLSWQPAWLKFLPKPGAWMERFKMFMGFPMLATAVWLFTLAASNYGSNGDLWLGLFLVLVAMSAWLWGQFVQRGRTGRGVAMAVCAALLASAYGYILEKQLDWRHPAALTGDGARLVAAPEGIDWQAWSPEALQSARASGRPVLVDFTAKWCLTCQINVKPVLESAAVRAKLTAVNAVALLENSFTKSDVVVAELNRYERAGVPLVLVYPRNPDSPPQVLPNLITERVVLDALDKAAQP